MHMTPANNSTSQPNQASLITRMAVGAGIGLLLISLYLLSADEPDPAWVKFWMIRPLIIVPLAGATGGLCNYFILRFQTLNGLSKALALIISLLVFVIGIWMGIVLGLDGTWWD
jgi:hypothetical protein